MARQSATTVIEVFADIWCPFTHVGLRALVEQRQRRGREDVGIWVRSWPLEWVNRRPMSAEAASDHADELRRQVSSEVFTGFRAVAFPRSTLPVLALVARAYKRGLALGEALSFEVRDRLFEAGQDVSDPDVLDAMAAAFELGAAEPDDYATVVAEWDEGRRRGVVGSPHLFCGTTAAFCPSLDITKDPASGDRAIHLDAERLGAFLDACLA